MSPKILLSLCLLVSGSVKSLSFPKVRRDSIQYIDHSDVGYTSRSTNGIMVWLKNGDSVCVLWDSSGRISPMTLQVSPDSGWISFNNPDYESPGKNCPTLLCRLDAGLCKCADVIADQGYALYAIPDSTQRKWYLGDSRYRTHGLAKGAKPRPKQELSEQEVLRRFLSDYNPSVRVK